MSKNKEEFPLNTKENTNKYSVFKVFKKRGFWIFALCLPFVLVTVAILLTLYTNLGEDIGFYKIIWMYFSGVAFICMITLLVNLIIYTVIDFKYSSSKGKFFWIILLLMFTLKACASIARSGG
ncbi:MAG: hypothetical protein PHI24_14435 [Desulfitobacteriaceae bacterium]|nr:hypothetical protein [Desulfitobacteriaceae bacterium]